MQPPHPVPALQDFLIESMVWLPFSFTSWQSIPLVTASHEQISASSGKLITPAPVSSPPRDPNIRSSESGGRIVLFLHVCSSILYCSASPTRIPPSSVF